MLTVDFFVYSNLKAINAEISIKNQATNYTYKTVIQDFDEGWNEVDVDEVWGESFDVTTCYAEIDAECAGGESYTLVSTEDFVLNQTTHRYENHDIEFYFDNKEFHDGWNWESFPKLTANTGAGNNNSAMDFVPVLENNIDPGDYLFLTLLGDNDYTLILRDDLWSPTYCTMWSTKGVKINLDNEDLDEIFIADGIRVEEDTQIDLHVGWNWIGYWMPKCQDMDEAFGEDQADDFWQYVEEVKSEHWYYGPQPSNNRGEVIAYKPSLKMRTLEYGQGYEVKLSQAIDDFYWQSGAETSEGEKISAPETFIYEEKPDYEVIDILEIPENVTEIGVFQDDTCVGAVVIKESSEQILVYTENASRGQVPFEFEVVTNNRAIENILNYQVFNELDEEFENRSLIAGSQSYSVIKFGSFEEPQNEMETIEKIKLIGNYPNPFNPSTTISFSLSVDQNIDLVVYNTKGQAVKKLVSGQYPEGIHSMTWDGKDDTGKDVSSGLYFYKLITPYQEISKKMLLLK